MIWHMLMRYCLDELLMDEVFILWTSSIDCECITSLMSECIMFPACYLRTLQLGVTIFLRFVVDKVWEIRGYQMR
jgi:hypothetical protein